MSQAERLRWLEELGQVPEDADVWDWELAQKTSWWGKPLDPTTFWAGRVIWLDESAQLEARRHGRGYPPMPYEDPTLPRYPQDEGRHWNYSGVEGPSLAYVVSSKESAFWDKFGKTMPKPPESVARQQQQLAQTILGRRHRFERGGNPWRTTAEELAALDEIRRERMRALGHPPEALTDEALYWALVLKKREEYERFVVQGPMQDEQFARTIIEPFGLDARLIAEPLTEEQLKAANAWKIAYLQRLRAEKVDESYVNAYLKAWNLTLAEVFGEGQNP